METNDLKGPKDASDVGYDLIGVTLGVSIKFVSKGIKGIKTPDSWMTEKCK